MLTIANMDKFTSRDVEKRVGQRETVKRLPLRELRLGDVVSHRREYWTIMDYRYDDDCAILRRGSQYDVVPIGSLA